MNHTEGKISGLSAEPFITEVDILEEDEFCILASDGIWVKICFEKVITSLTIFFSFTFRTHWTRLKYFLIQKSNLKMENILNLLVKT